MCIEMIYSHALHKNLNVKWQKSFKFPSSFYMCFFLLENAQSVKLNFSWKIMSISTFLLIKSFQFFDSSYLQSRILEIEMKKFLGIFLKIWVTDYVIKFSKIKGTYVSEKNLVYISFLKAHSNSIQTNIYRKSVIGSRQKLNFSNFYIWKVYIRSFNTTLFLYDV